MKQAVIPILFAMICNATLYEPTERPMPLFEQTDQSVCIEIRQDSKTFLRHAALYAPVNNFFFPGSSIEEDKFKKLCPEFTLYWIYRTERSWSGSESKAVAHFVRDAETEHYDIYQVEYSNRWWRMVEVPSIDGPPIRIPEPIEFDPECNEYRHVGRSDNELLLAVKVWKYVQKERKRRRRAKSTKASVRRKRKTNNNTPL